MTASIAISLLVVFGLAMLLQGVVEHLLKRHSSLPEYSLPIVAWGAVIFVGYIAFWAWWFAPWLGWIVTLAPFLGALIYGIGSRRDFRAIVWGNAEGRLCRITLLLLVLGYLGILGLWQAKQTPEVLAAERFLAGLPDDNAIPRLFADRLKTDTHPKYLVGDWLSSDRPPLQTGFILLLRPLPAILLHINPVALAFAVGVLFQMIWVPGLWSVLRAIGASKVETLASVALTGCTGFCLLHSVYTWPKLGAAGLVMGAVGLLLGGSSAAKTSRWSIAGGLSALGMLAHGGVAFSLLGLFPILWRRRPTAFALICAAVVFLGTMSPWLGYQRFYDPPGNRLVKWHLAGVIPVDTRGTMETLRTSYQEIGWSGTMQHKLANLKALFRDGPWKILSWSWDKAIDRQAEEFFNFFRGLGLGSWILLFWFVMRLRAKGAIAELQSGSTFLALWSGLTLAVWVLLMFGPATTIIHQGSLVPLLVLFAFPLVTVYRWSPSAYAVIAVVQLSFFFTTWSAPGRVMKGSFSFAAALLAFIAFAAIALLLISSRRGILEPADGASPQRLDPPDPRNLPSSPRKTLRSGN